MQKVEQLNTENEIMIPFECHIDIIDLEPISIVDLLVNQCNEQGVKLSKAQIKQAIAKGALWLSRGKHTQRLRRLKKKLLANDILHFYFNPKVLSTEVAPAKLIADLKDYSVWFKPYGMLSQGSKWSDHCTITRYAQQYFPDERAVFIVHRLDRAATGLILVAHSKKAAKLFSALFEKHQLEKQYQIIVHGDFSSQKTPKVIELPIDEKPARSTFTFAQYHQTLNQSLVNVLIDTGRKHQIRKHAASIGFPVVGDRLHGDKSLTGSSVESDAVDLQLCAVSLSFTCPFTEQVKVFKVLDEDKPHFVSIEA